MPSSARATGGLTVTPAVIEVSIPEDQATQDRELEIKNSFLSPITIHPELRDAVERNGKIVPTEVASDRFQEVIQFDQESYTIPAGSSAVIKLRISDSPALAPGGHYVAIVLRQVAAQTKEVGLQAAISVMTYIVKESGAVRALEIERVSAPRFALFTLPGQTVLSLKNTGNVAVVSRGSQTVIGRGKVLSSGVINDGYVPLQPGAVQQLAVPLRGIKNLLVPAQLRIITAYRYEGSDQIASVERSLYFVPWQSVILLSILLVACFISLRINRRRKQSKKHAAQQKPARKLIEDVISHKEA